SGRHPNCFLNLFYGSNREVELVGVEDEQLQIPEHRADKIWRIHDGNDDSKHWLWICSICGRSMT
ncbi:MAG: hypothetical protein ACE5I1_18930, partial [bacterium]